MSAAKYMYTCSICGTKKSLSGDKPLPVCCDKVMLKDPLDQCTIPDHPEMVRNTDTGEPCDDGRGKESSGD